MFRTIKTSIVAHKIRSIMNEYAANGEPIQQLLGEDSLNIDHYIKSVLREALTLVYRVAPIEFLPPINAGKSIAPKSKDLIEGKAQEENFNKPYSYVAVGSTGREVMVIELPDSFLRLSRIKLDSWDKSVGILNDVGSVQFGEQYNKYTEGTKSRPCVNLVYSERGKRAIECHPSGNKLEYLIIVCAPEFRKNKGNTGGNLLDVASDEDITNGVDLYVSIDDALFDAWCYMAASLVYSIFERRDTAREMERIALGIVSAGMNQAKYDAIQKVKSTE